MVSSIITILVVALAINPKGLWFLIIPLFLLLMATFYLIKTGFFTPIYVSETGIEYKGVVYKWENLKITAYPWLHRSPQFGYYLFFGNNYYQEQDIKKAKQTGFYAYLSDKTLNIVLGFYNKKIQILNVDYSKTKEIRSTCRLNSRVLTHNEEHSDID